MNTINCRIKQNEHHDVAGVNITPAEAVLLRQIHDPSAVTHGKNAPVEDQHKFWKAIINPVAAGEATTPIYNGAGEATKSRARTDADELSRLRMKYNVRAKSGAHGSHIVDDLWPGLNPKLPETFEEIGLRVAAPEEAPAKAPKRFDPEPEGDDTGEAGKPEEPETPAPVVRKPLAKKAAKVE